MKLRATWSFPAGLLLAACCGPDARTPRPPRVGASASPISTPIPPPPAPREDGHLPHTTRPVRYALALDIDPRKESFSGSENIGVDVLEPTAHFVLNARGESIHHATLKLGAEALALHVTSRASHGALEPDEIVFSADRVIPRGRATLSIEYDAPFGTTLSGIYRASDAGETYAFSQFEAADARRAFPCFDEPGFKTPFDVTLTVPSGMLAFSNGAEKTHESKGTQTTFTFATTAPLPTYLVAFAVGHFDVVEGTKASSPPIRFITTHGRGAYTQAALRAAEDIVPLMAKYFGAAYPYEKLDLVAVPDFAAGGMENAGLITFRDGSVLLDEKASVRQRRSMVGLITHELSHQWFGDLVTMKWWDDLWLNEGFASWATFKFVDAYKPELGAKIDAASSATYVMDQDGLASARAIRQPVASVGQAMQAFDGITYQKGAAVLRMIEHWVGEEAFQRGVQAYLHDHAFGNATADDILTAIDVAAPGKNVRDLARAYLDDAGVPVAVVDDLGCGKTTTARGHEERFIPHGATGSPSAPWKVPLLLASKTGDPSPVTWSGDKWTLSTPGACPLFGNPDALGYYRVFWPQDSIAPLMKTLGGSTPATRLTTLSDAWAQVRAGKLDGGIFLRDVLPSFDHDSERHVIDRITGILFDMADEVDDATWPSFATYARARLASHLARLDRASKLDDDDRILRRTLVYAEVALGDDAALAKKLEAVAKKYAAGDKSVDADYGQAAMQIAARFSSPDALEHAVETASTPQAHSDALRAVSGVVTKEAARALLDWMITPAVKLQDTGPILWPLASHRSTRAATLAWVRENWDGLRKKLPGQLSSGLVGLARYACTPAELADVRAFYTKKAAELEGADRSLNEALETASLCVALRNRLLPEMRAALPVRVSSSKADGLARP